MSESKGGGNASRLERRPRRIGIHGPRNAGKTCYLGTLYGVRVGDNVHLTLADGDTINYLTGVWREIAQQRNPGATAMALPTNLLLEIGGAACQPPATVQLCDYAGALVQPAPPGTTTLARDLSRGVKEWFRSCHVVLVFIDSSQPDMEQLDALDLLLTELRKPRAGASVLERPLGLVLTKWDTQGPVTADAAFEEKRAQSYLQSNAVFRQIHQKIAEGGERVKVIPVSAFGNEARNDRPPPPDRLAPCHLYAPLLWAIRGADEAILEEAKAAAESHLSRNWTLFDIPLWSHPNFGGALGVYKAVKRDFAPAPGALADELHKETNAVHLRQWQRRLTMLGAVAAVPLALLLGVWLWLYHSAAADYDGLMACRQQNPGLEQAGKRLEEENRFLKAWHSLISPPQRPDVLKWAEEDAEISGVLRSGQQLEKDERLGEALDLYRAFVTKHSDDAYAREMEAKIEALQPFADDQREYEQFHQVAIRDSKFTTAMEADQKAQQYLTRRGPRCPRCMAAGVRGWRDWFNRMQMVSGFNVTVGSYTIPGDSSLAQGTFGVRAQVHVTLNGVKKSTDWIAGASGTPNARLGPYPIAWKDIGKVYVEVEASRLIANEPFAKSEEDGGDLLLGKDNGLIVATDELGKQVTIHLHCEGVPPAPNLPSYRR